MPPRFRPSRTTCHGVVLTLLLPQRTKPAHSIRKTWKRYFLGNPRDALVVCCAVLFTRQFYFSVHALLYDFSNSLTLSTPMSPTYSSYVRFLHRNPVPSPALVPLAVPNSSPLISPHSLYSSSTAISFSS